MKIIAVTHQPIFIAASRSLCYFDIGLMRVPPTNIIDKLKTPPPRHPLPVRADPAKHWGNPYSPSTKNAQPVPSMPNLL